ncbi:MAG: PAS domain-containing sensor histidine kinase, partial [Pararhizobium sp.]|nr:PAS domain-containing sensor histidine kinase [Pararhizobium sp.]
SKFYAVGNDRDRATIAVMSLFPAKEPVASKPEPVMTEVVHAESLLAATGEPDNLQPAQTYESASVASGMPAVDGGALATDRRHPLRFVWQMNAEGRFSLGGDEFSRMLGPQTAAALGRPWNEIALAFGLDPEGRVAKAVATRDIWSGIMVNWPFDGAGSRLPVELSALPLHDRAHNFLGYRGFGICRDLDGLNRIASIRQQDGLFGEQATTEPAPAQDNDSTMDHHTPTLVAEIETEATPVETPLNILPFRPLADTQTPVLTQVENNAFDEIARRLSEGLGATRTQSSAEVESPFEPFADIDTAASEASIAAPRTDEPDRGHVTPQDIGESVAPWLSLAATPPSGQSVADRPLLDLMPAGILIYRLEHLLYANTALLARIGFANLPALQAAGGLEALEIEPQSSYESSTSADGMPLTVTAAHAKTPPAPGRLFSIQWDDEPAHALVLSTETIEPV